MGKLARQYQGQRDRSKQLGPRCHLREERGLALNREIGLLLALAGRYDNGDEHPGKRSGAVDLERTGE